MDYTSLHSELFQKFDFTQYLEKNTLFLERKQLTTLQVNLGKLCNQVCFHCHVDAGPKRTEQMQLETVERIVQVLKKSPNIDTVDITGGAPEMNPHFRYLIQELKPFDYKIIDRCNLTILLEQGQEDLVEFLANHRVEIIASLPCYLAANVDQQRGKGIFKKSIAALQRLNQAGYGQTNSGLALHLVYNPINMALPPSQSSLEETYKKRLKLDYGVEFNNLFTITNMPISRFAQQLKKKNQLEAYMTLLIEAFNPTAIEDVMCRNLISIDWQGKLYDCDFNQMLALDVPGNQKTIWDIDSLDQYQEQSITTGAHCFGCTAGAGSSCGGALTQ